MNKEETGSGGSFGGLAEYYLQQLEALRDLLLEAAPSVSELDSPQKALGDRDRVLAGATEDERLRLLQLLRSYRERLQKATLQAADIAEPGSAKEEQSSRDLIMPFVSEVLDEFGDRPWAGRFVMHFVRFFTRPPRLPIFYRSLVISAVSSFEVLLGTVVAEIYQTKPAVLRENSSEKEFSLDDLQQLGGVDDSVKLAIDRRVDDFLWKSMSERDKWFQRLLKVSMADLAMDWDATVEIFERRHLLVHSGGRVSRRYLSAVSGASDEVALGELLLVDADYVETAIDQLTVLGVLLPVRAWLALFKDETDVATSTLSSLVYEFVLAGRWQVVASLCALGKRWAHRQSSQWVFQANEWLSIKRTEGLDPIRAAVEAWDTSGADPQFRLVRWALLNRHDEALVEIGAALRSDGVSREDLYEWPVLEELRTHPRFAATVKAAETQTETSKPPLQWVYAVESGSRFHRAKCRNVRGKMSRIRRPEAFERGLRPCGTCKP